MRINVNKMKLTALCARFLSFWSIDVIRQQRKILHNARAFVARARIENHGTREKGFFFNTVIFAFAKIGFSLILYNQEWIKNQNFRFEMLCNVDKISLFY